MWTLTKEEQKALTPEKALQLLKDGNKRFCENLKLNCNLLQQINETANGQYPFAAILSCIDSRTSAELIFDQSLGDIFSIRIAGNIVNQDIIGSMEFAIAVAGAKLIAVIGHTRCGAIKGACDNVELGSLTHLIEKIKPAIAAEKETHKPQTSVEGPDFIDNVAKRNVILAIQHIHNTSPILKKLYDNKQIDIVGGLYDVTTGKVDFFDGK
jgi:carbonic anhydrase